MQYIHPADSAKLGQAELVVIDEAAAIPLAHVRKLLGPYLVFLASTVNGCVEERDRFMSTVCSKLSFSLTLALQLRGNWPQPVAKVDRAIAPTAALCRHY